MKAIEILKNDDALSKFLSELEKYGVEVTPKDELYGGAGGDSKSGMGF
ncbi:MAG: hypothetical protein QNK37_00525 [Acidobacteriota bacterium]|nr:hypothetical protein [Acidobacteriota bacterium]